MLLWTRAELSAVFARNLRRVRESRGLSQKELARRTAPPEGDAPPRLSQAAISRWEAGRELPRWEQLVVLIETLQVALGELIRE